MKTLSIKSLKARKFKVKREETIIEMIQNLLNNSYFILVLILNDGTIIEYHWEDLNNPIMEKFDNIDDYTIYCGVDEDDLRNMDTPNKEIINNIKTLFEEKGNNNLKSIYITEL